MQSRNVTQLLSSLPVTIACLRITRYVVDGYEGRNLRLT
jgi:hypothetical protein